MQAHLIADVTLYRTEDGGRRGPTPAEWFGCLCRLTKDSTPAWDCRLILEGRRLAPGETRRVGICFLSGECAAQIFRHAGKFFLWDMRIVGEAIVVPAEQLS
jgi:hypothetical protein